jgi:hypothetical protein
VTLVAGSAKPQEYHTREHCGCVQLPAEISTPRMSTEPNAQNFLMHTRFADEGDIQRANQSCHCCPKFTGLK